MDPNFFDDNGEEFLAISAEDHQDNFFDIGLDYRPHSLEPSNTSNSTESNFFDDLSVGSAGHDFFAVDLFTTHEEPIQRTSMSAAAPIPRSQKLVHRLRPEGVAISSAQLLALENKDHAPHSFRAITPSAPLPTTPPSTPLNRRSRPTTPISSSHRTHRATKTRSGAVASGSPKMMHPQAYHTPMQQSPTFSDWTERFKNVTLQNPEQTFPLSPPPSAKVSQGQQGEQMVPAFALDLAEDIFGPDSRNTAGESALPCLSSASSSNQTAQLSQSSWASELCTENFFSSDGSWNFPGSVFDVNNVSTTVDQSLANPHGYFDMMDVGLPVNEGLMIAFEQLPGPSSGSGSVQPALVENMESTPMDVKQEKQPQKTPDFSRTSPWHRVPRLSRAKSIPERLAHRANQSPSHSPVRNAAHKPHHRRTRSSGLLRASRTPKAPRIPKAPAVAAGSPQEGTHGRQSSQAQLQNQAGLGFVNYTPEDKAKILLGVAPSGSSKTKARRDKEAKEEAREKARKFSEAAERAVIAVGGDIEAVRRELSA
ncbi:MAG: hypothetical protein LQ340_004423 [Diploschistes diacapsis]|nr:MAG: hypothetical protein LQ340_004423 [Diploschistes diacapsis]